MPIESREILKTYFQTGDVPTQDQFGNLIESYIHRTDDGVYIYKFFGQEKVEIKRFGIGLQLPDSPLGIKGEGSLQSLISLYAVNNGQFGVLSGGVEALPAGLENKTLADRLASQALISRWSVNLNPEGNANIGFNISQDLIRDVPKLGTLEGSLATPVRPLEGGSLFFIQGKSGNIGMGTTRPASKLHLENSVAAGITGVTVLNTASIANQGWLFGHLQDGQDERNGAFSIVEHDAQDSFERFIIRHGGDVGISEAEPNTKLHVSKALDDPNAPVDLRSGTGIAIFGPITQNITLDFEGVQARSGSYIGTTLVLDVAELNFQRLGGTILIHGDDAIDETNKAIITEEAKMGLGTISPLERMDIDGAIRIGNTTGNNEGTIRFTGDDFEGKTSFGWVSLTEGFNPWSTGPNPNQIYFDNEPNPIVSIGTSATHATLTVEDNQNTTTGNTAVHFNNQSVNSGGGVNDNRVALEVRTGNPWGGNTASKDIGLYVSSVNGQTAPESNIAAVLNGNTLIGNLVLDQNVFGTNAVNILGLQNGVVPGTNPADTTQVFAADYGGLSTLHVLRENNELIRLYKESALTPADNIALPDTYDLAKSIIDNMRARINELESKLQAIGFIG